MARDATASRSAEPARRWLPDACPAAGQGRCHLPGSCLPAGRGQTPTTAAPAAERRGTAAAARVDTAQPGGDRRCCPGLFHARTACGRSSGDGMGALRRGRYLRGVGPGPGPGEHKTHVRRSRRNGDGPAVHPSCSPRQTRGGHRFRTASVYARRANVAGAGHYQHVRLRLSLPRPAVLACADWGFMPTALRPGCRGSRACPRWCRTTS
jgi:hypothetical protein